MKKNINSDVAQYLFNIRLDCLPKRIGVYQRDVRPDLVINFELLEEQLQETPEMLAFWDQLLAEQKALVAGLLVKKSIMRGYITKRMLKNAQDAGVRLRTTDMKDVINADPDLVKLEREIITESRKEDKVRSVVKTIQVKAEHLRSLAGFKREENSSVWKSL